MVSMARSYEARLHPSEAFASNLAALLCAEMQAGHMTKETLPEARVSGAGISDQRRVRSIS